MDWIDTDLARGPGFRREIEEILAEIRIAQDLAALRETGRVSQAQLARRLGVSQPFIAKLEFGKVSNIELRTLVRYATALGGQVRIEITRGPEPAKTGAGRGSKRPNRAAAGRP